MKPTISIFLLFVLSFGWRSGISQVVVFSDDFTDSTDPAWTTTGNLGGSAWDVFRSGIDWGSRRNDSPTQLEFTNDVGADPNANGYSFAGTSCADFPTPYVTILDNGGIITWTFNMRQIRTDPSGFDSGSYGVAFILAGEAATTNASGSGYAVVLGGAGATDPIRLIRYINGLTLNSEQTNILVSNTTGLTDFGNQYLSIKVTFNPCLGGEWELFVRNDGSSAFVDPLSGSLVSQGTATDNTFTNVPLEMMAAYWQGSTGGAQTAFFNNVTVSVIEPPAATPGTDPVICSGITEANLYYSGLMGAPDLYNIDWDLLAESEGFTDVAGMTLPLSPVLLSVPGGATPAVYSGLLTLVNSTTQCESVAYPISVTINTLPAVSCPNDTLLCSNEPSYTLSGGAPIGGTYTGTGVSGGMFEPGVADPGINIISYSYVDGNMCSNSCNFEITVNIAPVAIAGSYGPACLDDADIMLSGMPVGGTWSGPGVTGDLFDPSFGTQTLTYTYTDINGCTDTDQTTIMVSSCAAPSTMRWTLLPNGSQSGSCTSNSDCDQNIICYALEYTPLYTGQMTAYTTGFFMDCDNGTNPIISNTSCVMNNNSLTQDFCAQVDSILFNSSGNTGSVPITAGVSINIHQVCFTIPSSGVMIITKDPLTGLTVAIDLAGGGFTTENVLNYDPYVVDSTLDCSILPLRWLDFTAKAAGDYTTQLDWITADEINNSHFEIQRANDEGYVFQTIGRVEADDPLREIHTYSFADDDARPGKNYYRLKQVDYDGHFRYSALKSVSFLSAGFKVRVWPNPAQEVITVYVQEPKLAGNIELIDMSGRRIVEAHFKAGQYENELAVYGYPSGVYTLVVSSGDHRYVQKVVLME